MRFLADENFPRVAVDALEEAGHDVLWVRRAAPGASDLDVLAMAARDRRVVLTFDKDFGELTARSRPALNCGVILFRIPVPKSEAALAELVARITARGDWAGQFAVVEPGRIRARRRPR